MLKTSIHRPAVSLLLCEAQPRTPWVWAGLVMATIVALPQTAQAQTLMDVTGATAIQGTLNNINLVPASGTIQKARDTSAAAEASLNQRSSALPAPGAAPAGSITPASRGGSSTATPAVPTTTTARVNGQAVPICSHGGLCHGALLRAMGGG